MKSKITIFTPETVKRYYVPTKVDVLDVKLKGYWFEWQHSTNFLNILSEEAHNEKNQDNILKECQNTKSISLAS